MTKVVAFLVNAALLFSIPVHAAATVEDSPEQKDDARFGLDQLRWVERRVLGRLRG